ncbi:hypothetical protein C8F01DRAFT_926706, partial [Mycena amicta]
TGQRLGKIPLVIGMPVVITHNFDVGSGVVNGSQGTVESIRFETDGNGRRHAISCVVHIPDMVGEPLPGLREKRAAITEEKVTM